MLKVEFSSNTRLSKKDHSKTIRDNLDRSTSSPQKDNVNFTSILNILNKSQDEKKPKQKYQIAPTKKLSKTAHTAAAAPNSSKSKDAFTIRQSNLFGALGDSKVAQIECLVRR